jgi:protein-S-isoprenylcysteine O-methyltransferase Ste14
VNARVRRAGELVFGHALPAALFALFTVLKGGLVLRAASTVAAAGPATSAPAVLQLATQLLGVVYFGLIALLFVIRLPRLGGRRTAWTIAVAVFASFAILTIGLLPDNRPRPFLEALGTAVVALGLAYSIWALVHLRRSFSILPESRRLVRDGPYAFSRHPLYLGETVAAVGVLIPVAGLLAIGLLVLNVAAQLLRIQWEEEVLRARFPEYEAYAGRVPRYLPLIG